MRQKNISIRRNAGILMTEAMVSLYLYNHSFEH